MGFVVGAVTVRLTVAVCVTLPVAFTVRGYVPGAVKGVVLIVRVADCPDTTGVGTKLALPRQVKTKGSG